MKSKRKSYEIVKEILYRVKEKEATYAELERSLSTNPDTIRDNCKLLETLGQVKITIEKHPSNNRNSNKVTITEQGSKSIKNFEK